MRTFEPSNVWPSATAERLPPRLRWVSLIQAPVPYIGIRERGQDAWLKLWLGEPIALDPDCEYEVRNIADGTIDAVTAPGPTVATLTWLNRKTILATSRNVRPCAGGDLLVAFSVAKIQAAALTWSGNLRFTAPDFLSNVCQSAGVITWAGVYPFDPVLGTTLNNGAINALNNSATMQWLRRDGAVESQVTRVQARGWSEYVAFPVTTTPTVFWSCQGRVWRP